VLDKAKPGRVRHGGQLEVFFDDTQIEVDGRWFKGTALNYEGKISYSWQTLWVGPFLADGEWGPGNTASTNSLGTWTSTTRPASPMRPTRFTTGLVGYLKDIEWIQIFLLSLRCAQRRKKEIKNPHGQ